MNKQKIGLFLFGLAIVWAFFWGILASIHLTEFHSHVLSFEELKNSVWALDGALRMVWAVSLADAALIGGIGLLLYSGANSSTIWKFFIIIFVGVLATLGFGHAGHFSPLYAILGTFILMFFFGVLWLWAKERKTLSSAQKVVTDYRLMAYVFMLLGAWFTCGIISPLYDSSLTGQQPFTDPIIVMIYFVLGWMFLFLSYYKSSKI